MRRLLASIFVLGLLSVGVGAQEAIYLIRHGEKELSGEDPSLTSEGHQRAADWAKMLRDVGLDSIITSDARRTRQTGETIAAALGLSTKTLPRDDVAGLVDVLEFDHEDDNVLVVAHTETIPRILRSLGVTDEIAIDQGDFANLFVLLRPASTEPVFLHFRMP